jgi:hypothetical protein
MMVGPVSSVMNPVGSASAAFLVAASSRVT